MKQRNRYYSGAARPHFDGILFSNPGGVPPGRFGDLLRWQLSGKRAPWPRHWPSPHPPARPAAREPGLVVTHVGHASVLVQTAGCNILFDPVWSRRVSPVAFAGPRRVNPPGIAFEHLPPIDLVVVTHNHYDHMDVSTLRRLKAVHDPLVATPLGNDTILSGAVPGLRLAALDWDDTLASGPLAIRAMACHHWSARGFGDRRHALWAAFAITGPAGTIYHVGDTGYHDGINYRAARASLGAIRLAVLPIGAYEPRWFMKGQHQNPDEAVAGFAILGADRALGHHWGTVQLTDEAIEAPREALAAALDRAGIAHDRFKAMLPGMVERMA